MIVLKENFLFTLQGLFLGSLYPMGSSIHILPFFSG